MGLGVAHGVSHTILKHMFYMQFLPLRSQTGVTTLISNMELK